MGVLGTMRRTLVEPVPAKFSDSIHADWLTGARNVVLRAGAQIASAGAWRHHWYRLMGMVVEEAIGVGDVVPSEEANPS